MAQPPSLGRRIKGSNQQAEVPGLTPVEALGLGWPGYEVYAFGQVALSQQGLYGMGQSHPVWSRGRQGVIVSVHLLLAGCS